MNSFIDSLQNKFLSIYLTIQKNIDTIANYILVVYAFFIPITGTVVHDGFQLLLILLLFKKDKLQTIKKVFTHPIALAFFLYVIMNYLGVLVSDDQKWSQMYARYYKFFIYSGLIVAFAKHAYIERILASFLAGVVFSALISYALILHLIEAPFPFYNSLVATASNPAPFMYHIEFGFLLAFSAILLLQMLYQDRTKVQKLFIGFLFILISASIFLNISRTGYIIYILGIILFYFLHFRKRFFKLFPFLFIGLSSFIMMFYFSSSTFQQRSDRAFKDIEMMYFQDKYNTSLGYRILEIKQAYQLVLEKPLTGYGTARHVSTMYEDAKDKKLFYARTIKNYSTTDNQYFDVLLQWGIFGLLIYLNIFYQGFRYKQEDKGLKEIQIILLTLYLLNGLQTYTMLGQIPYTFFFILTLTTIRKEKNSIQVPSLKVQHLVFYPILLALAMLSEPYIL